MPKLSPRDIRRKIQGYASRPYSDKLYELVRDLAGHVDRETHPT